MLADLEQALDTIILATDGSSVLPTAQHLAPVVKGPSARQSMMPNIKTRCTPAGDRSYGAGSSSGLKAKKEPSSSRRSSKCAPPPCTPAPAVPTSTATPTVPTHHQEQYSAPPPPLQLAEKFPNYNVCLHDPNFGPQFARNGTKKVYSAYRHAAALF
ncbi:hypothetical protein B0H14DRAFT_2632053 [Mycena olivaceomarginata]|nr:hypothetical protein B0H14DRAFT_2632053 [Mycena olivaceomarginata]